jgi:hypothetical protein
MRGPRSGKGRTAGVLTEICMAITLICMRTTLDFEARILREAKKRAVEEGETLTRLIEKALRLYLRSRRPKVGDFRLELLTKQGRAAPGVNWDDRESLYEKMDGRS